MLHSHDTLQELNKSNTRHDNGAGRATVSGTDATAPDAKEKLNKSIAGNDDGALKATVNCHNATTADAKAILDNQFLVMMMVNGENSMLP